MARHSQAKQSSMADNDLTFDFEHQLEEPAEPLALPVSRPSITIDSSRLVTEDGCELLIVHFPECSTHYIQDFLLVCIPRKHHAAQRAKLGDPVVLCCCLCLLLPCFLGTLSGPLLRCRLGRMPGVACSWRCCQLKSLRHQRRRTTDRWAQQQQVCCAAMHRGLRSAACMQLCCVHDRIS